MENVRFIALQKESLGGLSIKSLLKIVSVEFLQCLLLNLLLVS